MRARLLVPFVVALAIGAPVRAQSIVVETYSGQRRADADRLMAAIVDELGNRHYIVGAAASKLIDAKVSRPGNPDNITLAGLAAKVDSGYRAWMQGDFAVASDALQGVIDQVAQNPAAVALDQQRRPIISKAMIGLSLSELRQGDHARAEATMADHIRAFPDVVLSRVTYGPEAFELYQQVTDKLNANGRGVLTVNVDDPSVVVFVDERFEAVGNVKKGDLLPGLYRIYTQRATQGGRSYTVEVKPKEEATLAISWLFDSSLVTSPTWAGFVFPRPQDRKAHEHEFATRLAHAVGATGAVVIGIDTIDGRQAIVGSVLSLETGEPVRSGTVFLEPNEPSEQRLRVFARFLAGDDNTKGIDQVKVALPPPTSAKLATSTVHASATSAPRAHGPWRWVAAGGAALALGGGVALLGINGHCTAAPLPGDTLCQRVYDTSVGGYAAIGGGVALGALATYLFLAHRGTESSTPDGASITPTAGGMIFTWGREF